MGWLAHVRTWTIDHDDRRSFVWPYFCISIVAGCFLSLFWLALLMAVHFGMEFYRQRTMGGSRVFFRAAWEVKLDFALLLISVAISVYMDAAFGVLGIGRASATVARAGARVALIQKIIRPVLLSLDDVFRILGMLFTARGIGRSLEHADAVVVESEEAPWAGTWSWGDRISIGIGVLSLVLLALSPAASGHDADAVLRIVVDEFRPFSVD